MSHFKISYEIRTAPDQDDVYDCGILYYFESFEEAIQRYKEINVNYSKYRRPLELVQVKQLEENGYV